MLTDVGRVRSRNEDACAADAELELFVVADGMGGAAGGEVASHEAVESFLARARQLQFNDHAAIRLEHAMLFANRSVYERALRDPRLRGMGTTMVALEVHTSDSTVWVAHAGDSRCYRLREGKLERLTGDHSLVEEQVRSGEITPSEAQRSHLRNVITRVIGSHPDADPEIAQFDAVPGDLFLLCSDGLTRDLADFDLQSILQRHRGVLSTAVRVLIDAANLLGGGDNITVVLVELPLSPDTSDPASKLA